MRDDVFDRSLQSGMIHDIPAFIRYFDGIRRRTLTFVWAIPANKFDWSPQEGELTCVEIVRHLAAAEVMFVTAFIEGRWLYPGHEDPSDLDQAVARLVTTHTQQMDRLRATSDEELFQSRPTLNGPPAKAWRLLMAMIEHEVHHRSQLAVYLAMMGVEPPQIYGLGFEDIIKLTTGQNEEP